MDRRHVLSAKAGLERGRLCQGGGRREVDGLAALPDIRKGLPRSEMEELIFNDVAALSALCRKHGTFGDAVLPGAFEPITGILMKVFNGNETEAFLETGSHYFFISAFTS